jgi:hypothetical protein
MSVHWLNSIARTPRGVPTFEDATVVVAAVATSAASIIAAPGLGGVAGACLACLMVAIAAVDARRAAALALGLVDAAIRQPDAIGAALADAALRAAVSAYGRPTGACAAAMASGWATSSSPAPGSIGRAFPSPSRSRRWRRSRSAW